MDNASQNAIALLGALHKAIDDVHKFVYRVFIDKRALRWTQHRNVKLFGDEISGDYGLMLGCCIWRDASGSKALIFSVHVSWDSNGWAVFADVEDEDGDREQITDVLWESTRIKSDTLEGFVESLHISVQALISSVYDKRVAAYLSMIEHRP